MVKEPELDHAQNSNAAERASSLFMLLVELMFVTSNHIKGMSTIGWSKFIPHFVRGSVATIYVLYVKYILPLQQLF